MSKKALAILLSIALVLTMSPMAIFADGETPVPNDEAQATQEILDDTQDAVQEEVTEPADEEAQVEAQPEVEAEAATTALVGGAGVSDPVATVNGTGYASLEDAFKAATSGDEVAILKSGTYELPSEIDGVYVKAETGVDVLVDYSAKSGQLGKFDNTTFSGITFKFPKANYTGFQHSKNITFIDCTLNGLFFSYGDMSFSQCTFNAPGSEVYCGGADYSMWCYAGNLTYTDCIFNGAGKYLNVYNEGNTSVPWKITATGCTFNNAGKSNKAAFNVKETSGSIFLKYDVEISSCKVNGAFPEAKSTSTTVVIDPLVQVDSRSEAQPTGIMVKLNGSAVYPTVVAQIGDDYYATLDAAIDAAIAKAKSEAVTVEILDNIALSSWTARDFTKGSMITINGNGYSISGLTQPLFGHTGSTAGITFNDVTITDSKIGSVDCAGAGAYCAAAFVACAGTSEAFNFNNCSVTGCTIGDANAKYTGAFTGYAAGYSTQNNGPVFEEVTITGGSVSGNTMTATGSIGAIVGHATGSDWTKITVDGTSFTGNNITCTATSGHKAGSLVGTIGTAGAEAYGKTGGVVIKDATVSGNTVTMAGASDNRLFGRYGSDNGGITINGGSYDADTLVPSDFPSGSKFVITGGTFNGTDLFNATAMNGLAVSGGTFGTDVPKAALVSGYASVDNNDGTYTVKEVFEAQIGDTKYHTLAEAFKAAKAKDTVTLLSNVTVSAPISVGIEVTLDLGDYTIKADPNGNWSGSNSFMLFYLTGGRANMTVNAGNGGIDCADAGLYAFHMAGPSGLTKCKLTINGGNYVADTTVVNQQSKAQATINGGTFAVNGSADFLLNRVDANISTCKFVVTGGTFKGFNPSDNKADGAGTCYTAEGYRGYDNGDGTYTVKAVTYTAQIGDKKYETLSEAVAAAKNGETIELLNDVTDGEGIIIDKSITIDFGGFSYTVTKNPAGSTGTKTQAFQILKGNTVNLKNGTIAANNSAIKMLIQNYADTTLENMVLEGDNVSYAMSNNCGDVALTGDTTVKGTMDVSYWPSAYPEGTSVTVDTTGTIGTIEIGFYGDKGTIDTPSKSVLSLKNGNIDEISVYAPTSGSYSIGNVSVEDLMSAADISKDDAATVNTIPAGYAWIDNKLCVAVTVTFDDQGTTNAVAVKKGGKVAEPTAPSDPHFDAWYTNGDKFDFNSAVNSDITISAVYTQCNSDGSVAHKDATCTETGTVGGTYCTVCEAGKDAAEATIAATGHDWGSWNRVKDPTTTETGLEQRICRNDKTHVQSNTIAKLPTPSPTPTPGGGGIGGDGGAIAGGDTTAAGNTTNGANAGNDQITKNVEDNETPLAKKNVEKSKGLGFWLPLGIAALIALTLFFFIIAKRRRDDEEEEEA